MGSKAFGIGCAVAAIAGIPITILFYIYGPFLRAYNDGAFENVTINSESVASKTPDEVIESWNESLRDYRLEITTKGGAEYVSADDAGLCVSDEAKARLQEIFDEQQEHPVDYAFHEHSFDISDYWTYNAASLKKAVDGLACVSPGEKTEPVDAGLEYNGEEYVITEDAAANYADEDTALERISEAVSALADSVTVEDLYKGADITSDDPELVSAKDAANTILASSITIKTPYRESVLAGDNIQSLIEISGDNSVSISKSGVKAWVTENVWRPNYTVGAERTVNSPANGEITVSGGTYGMDVDIDAETTRIISELRSGSVISREPSAYDRSEKGTENDGVGLDFVEVDIDAQKVYLVINGDVDYETDCVTGLANGKRDTPKGIYYISWKTTDWVMETYGNFVSFWMPIDDSTGVGLHDATWRYSFGGEIYKTNGSHGCINLPLSAAEYIYENTEVGIPVIVH